MAKKKEVPWGAGHRTRRLALEAAHNELLRLQSGSGYQLSGSGGASIPRDHALALQHRVVDRLSESLAKQ